MLLIQELGIYIVRIIFSFYYLIDPIPDISSVTSKVIKYIGKIIHNPIELFINLVFTYLRGTMNIFIFTPNLSEALPGWW